jgi:PAS domain-containing protein
MTLAAQLAMGYENSRLFDELKRRAEDLENDVAERRQSAERYRMVVDQASDGIAISDERGRYVEVNPRMLEMLGYTRDAFLRLSVRDLIPKGIWSTIRFQLSARTLTRYFKKSAG